MDPQPAHEQQTALASLYALGVDLTSVRGCLLEPVSGSYRLAGWLAAPRRDDAPLDVQAGDLLQHMERRLHRPLWNPRDRAPFTVSDEPLRQPALDGIAIAASPRPHVRIWLAGLTATQSMAAALDALTGCPAHLIGHTVFGADLQVGVLANALAVANPDLIVIVGGYDNQDAESMQPLLELGRVFGQALARTAPAQRPGIVFAGNRWASNGIIETLQAAGVSQVEAVENVQPSPESIHKAPLAQAVNFYYWRLCRRTDGFKELNHWATAPGHVISLETSFAQLVQVWMELHDLQELHGVYCGPAWWLHVWARSGQFGTHLRYVEPNVRPDDLAGWPPLQFVSGDWPATLWPQPAHYWWDRSGLAPVVAPIAQVAPQAMVQVLRADLLEAGTPDGQR